MRRVVVTGMGLITCAGRDLEGLWRYVLEGRCAGTRRVDRFETAHLPTRIAATVEDFDAIACFGRRRSQDMDRVTQLSLFAAERAAEDARLLPWPLAQRAPSYRVGVTFGTGFGGIETTIGEAETALVEPRSRLSPLTLPRAMANATAFHIARRLGANGPNQTFSTACSSGSLALGAALRLIQHGDADVVIAGGGDAPIVSSVFRAWCALRVMTGRNDEPDRAFRPFDLDRDGFVLGEGAAVLVCEELGRALARDARIHGEIVGFGNLCDADKLTAPCAEHQAETMRLALRDANVGREDLAFVSAHGTATLANDGAEATAIRQAFGPGTPPPVTAPKPYFGHTMGASGAIDFILGLLALQSNRLHPIPNVTRPDPACQLDFARGDPAPLRGRAFMVNSFGFGGNNAVLIGRAHGQPSGPTWESTHEPDRREHRAGPSP